MDVVVIEYLALGAISCLAVGGVWLWLRILFESGLLAILSLIIPFAIIFAAVKYFQQAKRPLSLICVGAGLMMINGGVKSYLDLDALASPPERVEVAQLLEGYVPANRHIKIEKHLAHFNQAVYEESSKQQEWTSFYYPITKSVMGFLFGDTVTVLIDSKTIKKQSDIPTSPVVSEMTGLIKQSNIAEIISRYRAANTDAPEGKYLVIEHGASPLTFDVVLTLFIFGSVLVFVSSLFFVLSFTRNSRREEPETLQVQEEG